MATDDELKIPVQIDNGPVRMLPVGRDVTEESSIEDELAAMSVIAEAFDALDGDTHGRILRWVVDRYHVEGFQR